MKEYNEEYIKQLGQLIESQDTEQVQALIADMHPADIAELVDGLDADEALFIMRLLDDETAADVLVELDEDERHDLLEQMSSEDIADVLEQMDADDAVDVIQELDEEDREEVIKHIDDVEQAGDIVDLLQYGEETAGGYMSTEMIVVNENMSMPDCIRAMREQAEDMDEIYNIYVVDDDHRLKGIFPLKTTITNPNASKIKHVMEPDPISVKTDTPIDDVALDFEKYDLVAIPVVNSIGRLVGVITVDDVVDEINITVPVSCTLSGTGQDSHNATINNGQYNSAIGETTIKAMCNDSNGFAIYAIGYTDDEDFVEKSKLLGKDPYPLGATYAVPFSGNVQLLFYNDSLVDSSADLSNWESIYEIASEISSQGKKGYAVRGQSGNPIVSDFLPILWAFGGDIFSENQVVLDSPESREALEFYCKLHDTGGSYEKSQLVDAVSSGEAAFALGWPSWFISGNGSSAAIAQVPAKKNASAAVLPTGEIGNWLLGVTRNSANKDLALEAIKYLTSRDVQIKALEFGGVPTRSSIFRDNSILEQYPFFQAIYSGTNNSRVRPRTTKWSRIEDVFGAELIKCINGEQSVDDTIRISQEEIEKLAKE